MHLGAGRVSHACPPPWSPKTLGGQLVISRSLTCGLRATPCWCRKFTKPFLVTKQKRLWKRCKTTCPWFCQIQVPPTSDGRRCPSRVRHWTGLQSGRSPHRTNRIEVGSCNLSNFKPPWAPHRRASSEKRLSRRPLQQVSRPHQRAVLLQHEFHQNRQVASPPFAQGIPSCKRRKREDIEHVVFASQLKGQASSRRCARDRSYLFL